MLYLIACLSSWFSDRSWSSRCEICFKIHLPNAHCSRQGCFDLNWCVTRLLAGILFLCFLRFPLFWIWPLTIFSLGKINSNEITFSKFAIWRLILVLAFIPFLFPFFESEMIIPDRWPWSSILKSWYCSRLSFISWIVSKRLAIDIATMSLCNDFVTWKLH